MTDSGENPSGQDAARPTEPTDQAAPVEPNHETSPPPTSEAPQAPEVEPVADPVDPAAEPASGEPSEAQSDEAKPAAEEVSQQDEPAAQAESDEAAEAKSDEAKSAEAKSDDAKPAAEESPQQDEPAAQAESDEAAGTQPDTEAAAEPPSGEQAEARTASTSDPKPSAAKKKPASRSAGKGGGGQERRAQRKIPPRRSGAGVPWDEPLALVRYGRMSCVGVFRHNLDPPPKRDTQVVIRTDRGVELGLVLSAILDDTPKSDPATPDTAAPAPEAPDTEAATQQADCGGCGGGGDSPASGMVGCDRLKALGAEGAFEYGFTRQNKILRLASPQDMNDQVHLDRADREKMTYCGQGAAEMGLKMKLVAVEHLLGGERVIFYFTSEARVDFRDLVRRLAGQYRTRIEMRQIGARDEARLVGDYERCGQRCCCQVFLGTLQPVSIRMAKVQKATLDPSKISGRCNRLMCCLRFEDETYEHLRKLLPKKNIWVRTEDLVAKVLSSQILTQLVRVIDVHGTVSVIDNDAIVERDVAPPDPNAPAPPARRRVETPAPKQDRRSTRAEPVAATTDAGAPKTQQAPANDEGQQANGEKRRRRRRGKGRQEAAAGAQAATTSAGGGATAEGAPKKRRRRRRRKPKGGGAGGGPPS